MCNVSYFLDIDHSDVEQLANPGLRRTTMDILEQFYQHLKDGTDFREMTLHHSDIHYVRIAIREHTGVDLTHEQVDQLLYEEGLLPASRYGIPKWFRDKWLIR